MARTSSGRLVKTSLQLSPEQHTWLVARAAQLHASVATVVRQLVAAAMAVESADTQDPG